MATLSELQERLENLRRIRAKGMREYEIEGRRMVYKDDAELIAAIADVGRQIAGISGTRIDTIVFSTSKGI